MEISVNIKSKLVTDVLVNNSEYNEFLLSLPFVDGLQLLFSPKNGLMEDSPIAFSFEGSCHTDNFSEEISQNDKVLRRYTRHCPGDDTYTKLNGASVSLKRDMETVIGTTTSTTVKFKVDLPAQRGVWAYLANLHVWFEPSESEKANSNDESQVTK